MRITKKQSYRDKTGVELFETLEARTLLSTYYVATNGTNGATGTTGSPWKTLQYAADHVAAGDTVIVAPGNYSGFDIRTSGTANARIVFKAQPGAVINQVNTTTNKDGINIENASYITIDGFKLQGTNSASTSRAGIRVVGDGFGYEDGSFSKGVILQNNVCDQWGYWGILTGFCDDMIIQNNVCSRSVQQHGIYFSNSGDRPIIRNNVCWGNTNCGIHMNGDIETGDTSIPGVDGIISNALVDGNTCYNNGVSGGSAINCDGVRNSRVVNNLLYDNHATGIALYQIDGGGPSIGNTVANNTVINGTDSRWCLLVTDGAVNTTVFNNILYNLNTSSLRGAIELSADSVSGFKSDYNLTDNKFSHSENVGNFTTWMSLTGGDSHSSTMTLSQMQSLFSNYAGKDFSLAVASLALDKGASAMVNGGTQSAPANDLLGAARAAGAAWDIGAYERSGQSTIGFATLNDGRLQVNGTSDGDSITLERSGDNIVVTRNGSQLSFAANLVTSVDVYGNDGNDSITLGASMPGTYVNAGPGNDVVQGGDNRDTLSGGGGKDKLYGGGGDDLLAGNQSPDSLYGQGGKDRIYGGDGDDLLDGGTHNDRLWGDAGRNRVYGQNGDDTLYARNSSADSLFGGAGIDAAQIDSLGDVRELIENLIA